MSWVQGGSDYLFENGNITLTLTVGAGGCLVVSVGMSILATNPAFFQLQAGVSDSKGNVWVLAATSPVQYQDAGTYYGSQVWTFVATNVAGGSTVITIACGGFYNAVSVDEYSGVAAIRAIDAVSYNSTAYSSGLSSVDSLSIPVNGSEMVYSAAFADTNAEALTPTAGFNTRQNQGGTGTTLTTFDKLFSGGTADNTVSASILPGSLHVIILALSPTPVVSGLLLQLGYGVSQGITAFDVTGAYPYDNQAGNLLILVSRVFERGDYSISDTASNTWVTLAFDSPANLVVGYCLSATAGPNTVTLTSASGGDDVSFTMILAEYGAQGTSFTGSSFGENYPGGSANTGDIGANTGDLLVSALCDRVNVDGSQTGSAITPVGSSPHTWRYQFCSSGLFNGSGASVALADQLAPSTGLYSNTFTADITINDILGVILGFSVPPISLACPINNVGQLNRPYSGQLIASNGTPPYTFAIIGGSLPPGLSLDPSTGIISGVPDTVGSYPYTAQVTDAIDRTAEATCLIQIPGKTTCGKLPTLEITRDMDAEWGDHATFYITQDEPFPFTLRGLVLRMSYNQD